MAAFRLRLLKSLTLTGANVNGSTAIGGFVRNVSNTTTLPKSPLHERLMSNTASSVNLSSERINDNVVYSRHEDCNLHNLTVVQRFFEQVSLFPNATAVVSPFEKLLYIYLTRAPAQVSSSPRRVFFSSVEFSSFLVAFTVGWKIVRKWPSVDEARKQARLIKTRRNWVSGQSERETIKIISR